MLSLAEQWRRRIWATKVLLPGRMGADGLPREASRSYVPGLPNWETSLEGHWRRFSDRVTGETIELDLSRGAAAFRASAFAESLRRANCDQPATLRLLDLHPHARGLTPSLDALVEDGLVQSLGDGEFVLSDAVIETEGAIDRFLDAWSSGSWRTWLAASIGDWIAAYAEAEAEGFGEGLRNLCFSWGVACHVRRAAAVRRQIASLGPSDDRLYALADAGVHDLSRYLRRLLAKPRKDSVTVAALKLVADDASHTRVVLKLFRRTMRRARSDERDEVLRECAQYLASHGQRAREVLARLGSDEGGDPAWAAYLAITAAPDIVPELLERALHTRSVCQTALAAAILASFDAPWCHALLVRTVGSASHSYTLLACVMSLRESRYEAMRHLADEAEDQLLAEPAVAAQARTEGFDVVWRIFANFLQTCRDLAQLEWKSTEGWA